MGMILGFFLLIYILVAIGIYKLTKRFSRRKWVHHIILAILILIPTYDIIITNLLGAYYCLSSPHPKTYITEKVEYPKSIYWEDNVYPGFSEEDRKLMITNYLDGVYLNTMALNGNDGKVYVYECSKDSKLYAQYTQEKKIQNEQKKSLKKELTDLSNQISDLVIGEKIYTYTKEEFEQLSKERQEKMLHLYSVWLKKEHRDKLKQMIYYKYIINTPKIQSLIDKKKRLLLIIRDLESNRLYNKYFPNFTQQCTQNEQIYLKKSMPKMNYTVRFNEVKLNALARKFLYSDETKVIDNNIGKIIAYNRRYMPFFYNIAPDLALGNRYFSSWAWEICKQKYENIAEKSFPYLKYHYYITKVPTLNEKLYNKYIKKRDGE